MSLSDVQHLSSFVRKSKTLARPHAPLASHNLYLPKKEIHQKGGGPTIKTNSNEIFHPTKLKKRKEREERGRNNQKTAQRTADKQIARDPEHRTPDSEFQVPLMEHNNLGSWFEVWGGGWRESREALFMVQQISG